MLGEPPDESTECNARLFLGANYGDGTTTIRCQRAPDHGGLHQEEFERRGHTVTITWAIDERARCDHGCGQWNHAHKDDTILCPKDADDHVYSDCAHCHPKKPPLTCTACHKTYYTEGHKRRCPKEPYACTICGESGVGQHVWPRCPRVQERQLANKTADEFTE